MEQIILMIKIKSKENSWLESFHKRFGQNHLNDSSTQEFAKKILAK